MPLYNDDSNDKDVIEIFEQDDLLDEAVEVLEDIVPGADLVIIAPDEDDDAKVVEETRERDWVNDGDHSQFIKYVRERLDGIPRHTGQTTVGCERAIAYLKRLDKEISRAIQSDDDNVIDEEEAEKIRDTIIEFVSKLEDAYDTLTSKKRLKRKASVKIGNQVIARINDGVDIKYYVSVDNGEGEEFLPVSIAEPTDEQVQIFALGEQTNDSLVKEAGSAKIFLFEDPFLHAITRLLLNSHVSAGRDIEKVYAGLNNKYNFTPREELSIQELLLQKGFPMFKDLGRLGDNQDHSTGEGIDFGTTYHA
jgi:hypothetical protein